MTKIYFVVLHYQSTNETINCINSIKKLNTETIDCYIIIVDNYSPNNSGNMLKELYKDDEKVEVVLSNCNLGFAKGNNIGFKIAKNNDADFVVLINNDTLIKDNSFINKIVEIYNRTDFSVLGPDILSVKDNVHQNPMLGFELSPRSLRIKIFKGYIILLLNRLGLTKWLISNKNPNRVFNNNYKEECIIDKNSNLVLQGSCMIFSKNYMSLFDGLYEETFMYYEENILAYRCFQHNLKMVYSPKLYIEHYRGVATDMAIDKAKEKNKINFFYKNSIKSLSLLLGMVKK